MKAFYCAPTPFFWTALFRSFAATKAEARRAKSKSFFQLRFLLMQNETRAPEILS